MKVSLILTLKAHPKLNEDGGFIKVKVNWAFTSKVSM